MANIRIRPVERARSIELADQHAEMAEYATLEIAEFIKKNVEGVDE